jgi:hypothetical protein
VITFPVRVKGGAPLAVGFILYIGVSYLTLFFPFDPVRMRDLWRGFRYGTEECGEDLGKGGRASHDTTSLPHKTRHLS